jgi:hypothetical protein
MKRPASCSGQALRETGRRGIAKTRCLSFFLLADGERLAASVERRRNFSFHRDATAVRIRDDDQRLFATVCENLGYTSEKLAWEPLKGRSIMERFLRPRDDFAGRTGGSCLAERSCVLFSVLTTVHIINNFARCSHDPVAFAQLRADAPTEWSFSSLEEGKEMDAADWWKTFP